MGNVKRIYVEKKNPLPLRLGELEEELKSYLGITGLKKVRIFIRYDVRILQMLFLIRRASVFFQSLL